MTPSLSNGTTERRSVKSRSSIALFGLCVMTAISVSLPAVARSAPWVWPRPFAEAKLVDEYQTVDPWALKDAREQLEADRRAGYPEDSARVRRDRHDVAVALRAASPRWARCRGVGHDDGDGYFTRFWCTVRLTSSESAYEATRKITVIVRGREAFRTRKGWH